MNVKNLKFCRTFDGHKFIGIEIHFESIVSSISKRRRMQMSFDTHLESTRLTLRFEVCVFVCVGKFMGKLIIGFRAEFNFNCIDKISNVAWNDWRPE